MEILVLKEISTVVFDRFQNTRLRTFWSLDFSAPANAPLTVGPIQEWRDSPFNLPSNPAWTFRATAEVATL